MPKSSAPSARAPRRSAKCWSRSSSNEAPVYGLDSVPFLATGYDASKKLYAAQKPYLEKQLASEGLMLLYSVPWPPQGIYAKREINSVDELKGLKFRTYNAMIGRIAALAGASRRRSRCRICRPPSPPAAST